MNATFGAVNENPLIIILVAAAKVAFSHFLLTSNKHSVTSLNPRESFSHCRSTAAAPHICRNTNPA